MTEALSSAQNNYLKQARSLLEHGKTRKKLGAFVAEGARLVEDGLRSAVPVHFVLYSSSHTARVAGLLAGLDENIPAFAVEDALFASLADTETPQGILAIFFVPEPSLPNKLDFLLILDQLRDPGNLGTILRTAEAAGVQAVCLPPGATDPWAPKVVRSGMGAHFRLPILQPGWEELAALTEGMHVFHADMSGDLSCWQADFTVPTALLIGGEADGISPEGGHFVTQSVRIPMQGKNESLNAAVSASILLFEVLRQRSGQ